MHESPLLWEDPERAVEAMFLSVRLTLSLSLFLRFLLFGCDSEVLVMIAMSRQLCWYTTVARFA